MATMKLQEFVTVSLTEILKGVVQAQKDDEVGDFVAKGMIGAMTFPANSGVIREGMITQTTVRFDVAVTVESRAEGNTGAGFDIGVLKAGVGGDLAERSEGISRIQFAVPLVLPESETTRGS